MATKPAVKRTIKAPATEGEFAMAAADICKALTVNPPLEASLGEEALSKEIEALLPDIKEGDDLTPATWKTLKKLGWRDVKPAKAAAPVKPPSAKKVSTPKAKKGPSNKAVVYGLWNKDKGETDSAKLFKKVSGGVKESTIRSWINQWKKGTNLPGCATK